MGPACGWRAGSGAGRVPPVPAELGLRTGAAVQEELATAPARVRLQFQPGLSPPPRTEPGTQRLWPRRHPEGRPHATVRFCPQLLAFSESTVPGLCSGRHRVDEGALDSHWPCLPATRPPARPQRPLPAVSVRDTVTRAFWLHLIVLCQGLMQCHGDTV